jgi:hypothetical protein
MAAPSEKCMWLASEGVELSKRATALDAEGKGPEAAYNYKVAAKKFEEAAALCPEGHPDGPSMATYGQEIAFRAVYLESLGGQPATLPLEDHMGELVLTMDLSAAAPPAAENVSALLAKATSGADAAFSDEGLMLLIAMNSPAEMRVYVDRLLAKEGRRRAAGAGTDEQQAATLANVNSFAAFTEAVRRAPWVELDIDPKMDKLDIAMKLQKEAGVAEQQGWPADAIDMYNKSLGVLSFVHKHDARMKNEKIKGMVGQRLQDITARVTALGGTPVV